MKTFCTVVGKKHYVNKAGDDCRLLYISTSDFDLRDGFLDFEFYVVRCDKDIYESVGYSASGVVNISEYVKNGKTYKVCTDFKKVE